VGDGSRVLLDRSSTEMSMQPEFAVLILAPVWKDERAKRCFGQRNQDKNML